MRNRFNRPNTCTKVQLSRALVVCEDSVNSVAYLKSVCTALGIQNRTIIIGADGSAPKSVVEHAIREKKVAVDEYNEFNRVFVLIDRGDNHTTYKSAINTAKGNDIHVIYADPCFELWLLLHFECSERHVNGDAVCKAIKEKISGFSKKGTDYGKLYQTVLKDKTQTAIDNAKRLFQSMENTDANNPKTNFHELMEYLIHAARESR